MVASEALSSILKERYTSPLGGKFRAVANVGMTERQIEAMCARLAVPKFPQDIHKLLKCASGFSFYGIEEIRFDDCLYGYEDLFPRAVQLAQDAFGNFWAVDIKSNGEWGAVFYVSLDPAVIIKHSDSVAEFILDINEYGKLWKDSKLERIHREVVLDIWAKRNGMVDSESLKISRDPLMKSFARSLPENTIVADLRKKMAGSGFIWRGYGSRAKIIRHENEYIWAIHRPERKSLISMFSPAFHKTKEFGRSLLSLRIARHPAH